MSFVVDTAICSAFLKADRRVASRFMQYLSGVHLSIISVTELYSWAYRNPQVSRRLSSVKDLCADSTIVLVDAEIAERCGQLRADMLNKGVVVSVPDLLIASTALHLNFTLVTHNVRHFSMVPGLRIQDWLAA